VSDAEDPALAPAAVGHTLLKLRPRELLLAGFIDSRGLVIVGAAFGLLWEAGLFDPTIDMIFGESASGRGLVRQFVRGLFGGGVPSPGSVALMAGALAAVLLVIRMLSMIWSLVRLYGFRLERTGDDLRTEFGLFTRVMATIPLRRIQTLTIREGPLHRFFTTASVRVDSAGSEGGEGAVKRESLAPIIGRDAISQLLRNVLPDVDMSRMAWQPVDPRGFRRALRVSLVVALLATAPFVVMLRWWTLALLAVLSAWAVVHARLYVKHLGWALVDQAVLFRSGYLWRYVTIARFTKIQAVSMNESPFDRRARMARVRVDTAGASDLSHRVDIPYLGRDTAGRLHHLLAGQAARTTFRW
jgi:putative membrane protein